MTNKTNAKRRSRIRRHARVRATVSGTTQRPRLSVYRSNRHVMAQEIDDTAGVTLAAASTQESDLSGGATSNKEAAAAVGERIAERAKAAGVTTVVFDRGGFRFHGRVAALADAARSGGLEF